MNEKMRDYERYTKENDRKMLRKYRGAYSSSYLGHTNYSSSLRRKQFERDQHRNALLENSIKIHKREVSQDTLDSDFQLSGSHQRILRRDHFCIPNCKSTPSLHPHNSRINKRVEKLKYEPEELRSSNFHNDLNFKTYDTDHFRDGTITLQQDCSPFLRTLQTTRIGSYQYHPRRDYYRAQIDSYYNSKAEHENADLSAKISSLRSCINEIEKKQDVLLNRIDSKIQSRPCFTSRNDLNYSALSRVHTNLPRKADIPGQVARDIQRKVQQKSETIKKKYSQGSPEGYCPRSQPAKVKMEEPKQEKFSRDLQKEAEAKQEEERKDSKNDANLSSIQQFEKNIIQDSQIEETKKKEGSASEEKPSSPNRSTNQNRENSEDRIDAMISDRKQKIEKSRKERQDRVLYSDRSRDSNGQYSFSDSKNLFLSSNKPFEKHELINDSFGTPETKIPKPQNVAVLSRVPTEPDLARRNNNDHIIDSLHAQSKNLASFLPPSREEPVPITLEHTDLPIAYKSSPDIISFQYQPRTSQESTTRKKLFHSPREPIEEEVKNSTSKAKNSPMGYIYSPDTSSAMRAKDLHCGRGSSPLRIKLESKNPNQSRSNSISRRTPHKVEYYYNNGVINISTPEREGHDQSQTQAQNSSKDRVISQLKKAIKDAKKEFRGKRVLVKDKNKEKTKLYKCDTGSLVRNKSRKSGKKKCMKKVKKSFESASVERDKKFRNDCANRKNFKKEEEFRDCRGGMSRKEKREGEGGFKKKRPASVGIRTEKGRNVSESRMAQVQRKKQEMFRKRQEELEEKFRKRGVQKQSRYNTRKGGSRKAKDNSTIRNKLMAQDHDKITEKSSEKEQERY
ncbi:unnamed protein product [Moneuplotes crassus]|uniref:Uncharacterized protein n=1 Tax=Euplotes crassus TaxID=5936 RepID=A0AAD1XQY6_EUPCR|nr:unnamed protein product [Moneuplotes crassus]